MISIFSSHDISSHNITILLNIVLHRRITPERYMYALSKSNVGGLYRRRYCNSNPEMKPFSPTKSKIRGRVCEILIVRRLSNNGGATKESITETERAADF